MLEQDITSENEATVLEIHNFDIETYRCVLEDAKAIGKEYLVMMEHVHAMPGQGSVSMFNFGVNYGILQGLLAGLQMLYKEVTPGVWKGHFHLDSDKAKSIELARNLYPTANLKRTDKSRTLDHNRAEALLIAEYSRQMFMQNMAGYIK